MTKNMGIGLNNSLPWYYKEDLKRFAKITKGNGNNAIIMGRKTWESLPKKPLPGRTNIILSRTLENENEDFVIFDEINDALLFCHEQNMNDVWIIGGNQIYKETLERPELVEINMTLINRNYECDTFFKGIPLNFEIDKMEVSENNECYFCNFLRKY